MLSGEPLTNLMPLRLMSKLYFSVLNDMSSIYPNTFYLDVLLSGKFGTILTYPRPLGPQGSYSHIPKAQENFAYT